MILLAVFFYLVTFNHNNLVQPLGIFGPYSRAECMQIVRLSNGVWCQAIKVRK